MKVKITKKMELPMEAFAKLLKIQGLPTAIQVEHQSVDMRGESYGAPRKIIVTWTEEEDV